MFYVPEIAAMEKHGMALIWLAATFGTRSHMRRFTRKEISHVDVQRVCRYLACPPQPLALRLLSSLVVGISRIYQQQVGYYSADVNNVWGDLRRQITLDYGPLVTDMVCDSARLDTITLPLDYYANISQEPTLLSPDDDMVTNPQLDIQAFPRLAFKLTPHGDISLLLGDDGLSLELDSVSDAEAGLAFEEAFPLPDDDATAPGDTIARPEQPDYEAAAGAMHAHLFADPALDRSTVNKNTVVADPRNPFLVLPIPSEVSSIASEAGSMASEAVSHTGNMLYERPELDMRHNLVSDVPLVKEKRKRRLFDDHTELPVDGLYQDDAEYVIDMELLAVKRLCKVARQKAHSQAEALGCQFMIKGKH
ncbi:R8 protein [Tieghemiomyces parasiticus]|uniref:R8 protein n=1 Tax=Tieghemiomyces parasiticus TaxID=78921 RepID=A0A9W7ZZW1_9FUNG|nr:R8 protein [Tieghemiomyces parasiticus]